MNYSEQISLTGLELLKLKKDSKNYSIINLGHYPNDRKHLEARLYIETGFSITRNMDGYIFEYVNGKSVLQPENKWVAMANDEDKFPDCFKYNKSFDDVSEAVDYVYQIRWIQLKEELNKLESLR